jgi:hypothetical protein
MAWSKHGFRPIRARVIYMLFYDFNSLLGIVYVSFSMQFPTVEECDFDLIGNV